MSAPLPGAANNLPITPHDRAPADRHLRPARERRIGQWARAYLGPHLRAHRQGGVSSDRSRIMSASAPGMQRALARRADRTAATGSPTSPVTSTGSGHIIVERPREYRTATWIGAPGIPKGAAKISSRPSFFSGPAVTRVITADGIDHPRLSRAPCRAPSGRTVAAKEGRCGPAGRAAAALRRSRGCTEDRSQPTAACLLRGRAERSPRPASELTCTI